MKTFITGGSGFLGRKIVDAVKGKGHAALAPRSSVLDLLTGRGIDEYFEQHGQIDAIIHSAAHYGGIGILQSDPAGIFHRNCQMALNLLAAAAKYKVPKVVVVGSACAYPGYLEGDLNEANFWDGKLHETVEAYGFTKKVLLAGQKAYHKQYGIKGAHLILTNLYGPNDVFTEHRSHVVAALIKKFADARGKPEVVLWGDGSAIREFLYVEDAAQALARSLEIDHDLEPINVGTGIGTSIKELAELVAKYTGFTGKIVWDTTKPNGAPRKVLSVTKMKKSLGWQPEVAFPVGLERTIKWYLENKEAADLRE